jgi:predicted membrane protein
MGNDKASRGRMWFGILLIVIGGLFILDNYAILNFHIPHYFITWETFFILLGIFLLLTAKNKTAGIIFIALGLFNLYPELWPLLLVGIGLFIILRKRDHRPRYFNFHKSAMENADSDYSEEDKRKQNIIDDVSIFGGGTKLIQSDNFKGGNVTAIFGGSEINLSDCKLAEGEHNLEVTAIFGGSTLIVPSDWRIVLDLVPIFGGFGDKRRKDPNIQYQEDRILVIKGLVLFGGGEIKN